MLKTLERYQKCSYGSLEVNNPGKDIEVCYDLTFVQIKVLQDANIYLFIWTNWRHIYIYWISHAYFVGNIFWFDCCSICQSKWHDRNSWCQYLVLNVVFKINLWKCQFYIKCCHFLFYFFGSKAAIENIWNSNQSTSLYNDIRGTVSTTIQFSFIYII